MDQESEELEDSTQLWRYIGLAKFLRILSEKKLYLCRADLLGDRFEGSVPRRDFHRMNDAYAALALSGPTMKEKRLAVIHSSYVNCWRHGEESEAMWRLYCEPENEGVAMVSTYGKLSKLVSSYPDTKIGVITYLDYESDALTDLNPLQPIWHKRIAYKHEQEVRIVRLAHRDECKGFKMNWDLEATVEKLVISPFAKDGHVDTVKKAVEEFYPKMLVRLIPSPLEADPLY